MNFLYPLFTLASLAITIPILIHLFNFRRYKKVYFPDIRFLKQLQEQTQKQSRLKHLLILACRILAILSLVFAFAQPYFSNDKNLLSRGPKAVSIYIDNSFSMGIESNSLSLLDMAKSKAKDIIQSLGVNDQVQILTNDFAYNENRFLCRDEALRQLGSINVSPRSRTAQVILEKQKRLLMTEPGASKQLVYLSDFQKNSFPSDLTIADSIRKLFIPVNAKSMNNLSIDTAYFETPSILLNEANPLVVRVRNNGSEEMNTSVSVMVNGQMKSVNNTSLKPHEVKDETISYSTAQAGPQQIKIFLNDYPVNFDDTFFIAGKVSSNYAVMILNQNNSNAFLSSVFKPGTQFHVDNTNVASANASLFRNYTLIILNGITSLNDNISKELEKYVNNGGSILIFPPQTGSTDALNGFIARTAGCSYQQADTDKAIVTNYNKSHELFRDLFVKTPENIDLPVAFRHYTLSSGSLSGEQKLFSFSNSDAFLSAFTSGNGKLYLCASSAEISASTFPKSYWFLPLIYKMAYMNSNNSINALTLGRNAGLQIENNRIGDKTTYHIGQNGMDAIPEQRAIGNRMQLNLNNAIFKAGLYGVYLPDGNDTSYVGVNYDRTESDLVYWDLEDLKKSTHIQRAEWMGNQLTSQGSIHSWEQAMPLWKVCLLLALFFLLTEILLIRLMR